MKNNLLSLSLLGLTCGIAPATVLFSDNFNAPDNVSLDASIQAGRRAGLVPEIQVRSSKVQHGIVSNQLNFLDAGTGRIRFHDDPDNDVATAGSWHDWASGATGSAILGGGGVRIEFDWIAGNDSSDNWVSVNVGHGNEAIAEPGFRVNDAETDIGMLIRFNGASQLFDNGAPTGTPGNFTPNIGTRHVTYDYLFDSFADGTAVTLIANVDGTEIYNGSPFTWDNNGGALYFEIGTLENTLIDNLKVSSIPEPSVLGSLALAGLGFLRRRRKSQ